MQTDQELKFNTQKNQLLCVITAFPSKLILLETNLTSLYSYGFNIIIMVLTPIYSVKMDIANNQMMLATSQLHWGQYISRSGKTRFQPLSWIHIPRFANYIFEVIDNTILSLINFQLKSSSSKIIATFGSELLIFEIKVHTC